MLRKVIVWGFVFLWGVSVLSAQSNDRLDELLTQAPARLDSTCYLILTSVGSIPETADPGVAFQAAVSAGFLPSTRHPEDPVTIQDLSFLLMKTQKLSGGLEWMVLPSPRAAYRELVSQQLVNGSAGPERTVAGDEVVRTLNAVRASAGGPS